MTSYGYDTSKHRAWVKQTTDAVINNFKLVLRSDCGSIYKKREIKFKFKREGNARRNQLSDLEKKVEKLLDFPLREDKTKYIMYPDSEAEEELNRLVIRYPIKSDD